jgi:phosphoadenosine phosphosulfate reductase
MTAEEVVQRAVERHGANLVLLCSFQKTSSVLVDMLTRVSDTPRVATIDTGDLFPETMETWRRFEEHFGITIEVHDAVGPWTEANCCADAKVEALDSALDGYEAWMSGIRRGDGTDVRVRAEPVDHDERRGLVKYNPLVDWTDKDVWRRIAERDLPYHPLHDDGYDSIGCMSCTAPGRGREGRWAGSDRTECGIHVA